jgi:uncharacterized membrane protein YjjP (DUF1212 family)
VKVLDSPISSQPGRTLSVERGAAEAFILTLAEALHAHGAAAHRLEGLLTLVAMRLGTEARFYSTPTAVLVSFGPVAEGRTCLVRVEPGAIDLGKMSMLYEATTRVIRGELGPEAGRERVAAIVGAPPRYGAGWRLVAATLSSSAAAVFFGGGRREVLASGAVGLLVGLIDRLVRRRAAGSTVVAPVAAAIAAIAAAAAAQALGPLSTVVVTLAGVVLLLPGLSITIAMTELSTRHLASGSARFSGALVELVGLGFGGAFGAGLVRLLPPMGPPPAATVWSAPALGATVLVSATAVAVFLQAQVKDLKWILAVSAVGFAGTRLGGDLFGPELGAFIGALLLGLCSNGFARALDQPAAVPLVPGLILLVPGSIGLRSVFSMIESDVVSGVDAAFKMVLVSTALVAGILFANLAVPPKRAL